MCDALMLGMDALRRSRHPCFIVFFRILVAPFCLSFEHIAQIVIPRCFCVSNQEGQPSLRLKTLALPASFCFAKFELYLFI